MRILAVDTSGKELGIGIFEGEKCLHESYLKADRAYNRHIMPMVAEAMIKAGNKLSDIDVFAAALGPGSFTGIRVGMAVMKAFAHGLNKKFAGASTLDIMAQAAGGKGKTWAVMEAGRGEVFAGEYGKSSLPAEASAKAGVQSPRKKQKYLLLAREKFLKKLKPGDTIAGIKGENIMVELKEINSKIHIVELEHIDMKGFAALIMRGGTAGKKGIYGVSPVYIRPSEAEARRRKMKKPEVK